MRRFWVSSTSKKSSRPSRRCLQVAEVGDRRLVGRLLLGPAELEEAALRDGGARAMRGCRRLRRAGHGRGETRAAPSSALYCALRRFLLAPGQMAAGDMAGLVGDHARSSFGRAVRWISPVLMNRF